MNIESNIDLDAQKKREIAYNDFCIETSKQFSLKLHKANERGFIKAKEGEILAKLLKYPNFKRWDNLINLLSREQALDLLRELNVIGGSKAKERKFYNEKDIEIYELEKKVASLIPFFPFEHENKEFH